MCFVAKIIAVNKQRNNCGKHSIKQFSKIDLESIFLKKRDIVGMYAKEETVCAVFVKNTPGKIFWVTSPNRKGVNQSFGRQLSCQRTTHQSTIIA